MTLEQYVEIKKQQFQIMSKFGTLIYYRGSEEDPRLMPFSPDGLMSLEEYIQNDPKFIETKLNAGKLKAIVRQRHGGGAIVIYSNRIVPADAEGLMVFSSEEETNFE